MVQTCSAYRRKEKRKEILWRLRARRLKAKGNEANIKEETYIKKWEEDAEFLSPLLIAENPCGRAAWEHQLTEW